MYQVGNKKLQREIELAFTKFKSSKKTIDQYFNVRVVKAMKNDLNEYVIKAKKIDLKTLIIFGDNKRPDTFFVGKDFTNIKSFEPIAADVNMLMKFYGKPRINDLEVDYAEQKINIYHLKEYRNKHGQVKTAGYLTRHVPGLVDGEINIGVRNWPSTDVFWLPSSNVINNVFMCTKSEKCSFTCNRHADLKRHEDSCKDVQEITSIQAEYGSKNDEVAKLSDILNIDYSQFRQEHFACYDIETFAQENIQVPVSIAVSSTLEGPKYFERSDDTPEATYQMVFDFMTYLMELQQTLLENLAPEIEHANEYLQAEKDGVFNQRRYKSKNELRTIHRYFKNYECLKVYGFNSRYKTIFLHL